MLDIIIPSYNSLDTIEQTLCSIAYQDNIKNINVYIVDDCSNCDYSKIVEHFSNFMNLTLLKLEKNSGPAVARQYGIDNSNSEFIAFIDSDDVYSDCFATSNLLNTITNSNADVVISNFVEETNFNFIDHKNDQIWLHGKIYRRSFLEKNKIRFNESRCNEDNGFNQLIFLCKPNIEYIQNKTYIWRNNANSITRINGKEFSFKGLKDYVYNLNWAIENGEGKCDNKEQIAHLAFSALVSEYHYYLLHHNKKECKEMLKGAKTTKKYFEKYPIDEQKQMEIFENQFNFLFNKENKMCFLNPVCSFEKFLELLDSIEV